MRAKNTENLSDSRAVSTVNFERPKNGTGSESVSSRRSGVPPTPFAEQIGCLPDIEAHAEILKQVSGKGTENAVQLMRALQKGYGNRYLQRVLTLCATGDQYEQQQQASPGNEQSVCQERDDPVSDADPELVGNPLVGLTRGDGISWGTWENRPRVKLLQQKLNQKLQAGLNVDGMFGPLTEQALHDFQACIDQPVSATVDDPTADALMDRKNTSDEKDEKTPAVNQELEDTLDAVWLQYQNLMLKQIDALNRLERDLGVPETATDIVPDILNELASTVLGKVFDEVSDLVKKVLDDEKSLSEEDRQDLKDDGIDPIFDKLKSKSQEVVGEKVADFFKGKGAALDAFIDSQRSAISQAGSEAQEVFLRQTRPELRKVPSDPAIDTDQDAQSVQDPRIAKAEKLLKAIKNRQINAFEEQYGESLGKWAVYQAQKELTTVAAPPDSITPGRQGTDLREDRTGVHGVLEIEIEGDEPGKPVRIKEARIAGLSPVVRNRLNNNQKTIGSLDFPRRVEGDVSYGTSNIAKNELGVIFENSESDGKKWLREKAIKIDGPYGNLLGPLDEKHGARIVFDEEIDTKHVDLEGP